MVIKTKNKTAMQEVVENNDETLHCCKKSIKWSKIKVM
jgi:hypothetical protein